MSRVRKSVKQGHAEVPDLTFVLDNGAHSIKAGFAPSEYTDDSDVLQACETIPNCLVRTRERKTYVAAESVTVTQWSEAVFRRPVDNGQIVNWEAEKEIWEHSFFDSTSSTHKTLISEPADTTLILTEAPNAMPALQKNTDEIVMEEWGFGGYMRTVGPSLNAYNNLHPVFEHAEAPKADSSLINLPMECLLVVDSGFSSTIITPCFRGRPIQRAITRLDLAGKHLTNLLKEIVSIRHFDLHQDTKIVEDVKHDVAFVTRDMKVDLESTWKGSKIRIPSQSTSPTSDLRLDYVLPDGVNLVRGYSRPHDPSVEAIKKRKQAAVQDSGEISMTLGNERFTVPEILFNPADIGSKQPGLTDCIIQSLSKLPPLVQATMVANTLVVGGNANIPGFIERLGDELRAKLRVEWPVHVRKMENPITSTWLGGSRLACNHRDTLHKYAITKDQYEEHGSVWLASRFASAP